MKIVVRSFDLSSLGSRYPIKITRRTIALYVQEYAFLRIIMSIISCKMSVNITGIYKRREDKSVKIARLYRT